MSKKWIRCSREIRSVTNELNQERDANSSMVTGRSDPLDDFPVPSDDPSEEIIEQWHDDLHEWYVCGDEISVQSSPPESPVMFPTGEATTDIDAT